MSFSAERFLNTDCGPPGSGVYCYVSPDARSVVTASGYLNNNTDTQNVAVGDVIHVMGSNGGYALEVQSVSSSGDVVFYDHSGASQGSTEDTIYIKGDADTDGSIRLIVTDGETVTHIETRTDGVWNDSSLRFSQASVRLGRDMQVGAASSFLITENDAVQDQHSTALIPHIPFSDTGTLFPHTPILSALETDIIFGTAVSETTNTVLGVTFLSDHARLLQSIDHEVGTIGATDEVEYSVYVGTDNTGTLLARKNFPASTFVANTTVVIQLASEIGFSAETDYYIELTSDTAFSLKTDSSGNLLTTTNEQDLDVQQLVTENLIYDNDFDHVLDNNLNFVYENQF